MNITSVDDNYRFINQSPSTFMLLYFFFSTLFGVGDINLKQLKTIALVFILTIALA